MSTGENIQFLRKREGYTQETFAEKLAVSRQTVSKWESDSCYPEMDKLVAMCDMFRCNLDELVRGNVQADIAKDTAGYDDHMNCFIKQITTGVVLLLLGVCVMFLVYGLTQLDTVGGLALFPFLIAAIAFFVTAGLNHGHYVKKHPHIEPFYTEEEQEEFQKKFVALIVGGISMILAGVVFLLCICCILGENYLDTNDYAASLTTSGLMVFVSAGVGLLVYGGMQKGKYDVEEYNKGNSANEGDGAETKSGRISGAICACIMILATLVFLLTGFLWSAWNINWVAYVAGGLLCGIVNIICDVVGKNTDESAKK